MNRAGGKKKRKQAISVKHIKNTKMDKNLSNHQNVATPEEAAAYFKRILIMSAIAFPILSAWIIYDLSALETGTEESVRIWAPIAFLYNIGGYWPAILATPALGIFVLTSLYRKFKAAEEAE